LENNLNSKRGLLDRVFDLKGHDTNVRTEIVAGLTTFLTMGYIIAVNPHILSAAGMDKGALITATCLSAAFACFVMGFYANLPFALASGMGLNAFFAYTVCGNMHNPWQVALAAVFVEGIIFILLTLTNVREAVVNAIPLPIKIAVSAGIGLFIALIGLVNGMVVVDNPATLIALGDLSHPAPVICLLGVLITAVLILRQQKGAILIGIIFSTFAAWGYALYGGTEVAAKAMIFLPSGGFGFKSIMPVLGKLSFQGISFWPFFSIVVTLLFVDFFDTVGTLVGVATKAKMIDVNGHLPGAQKALMADAVGTTVGALMGVSTVTTYVESAAGVAAGGRTGLTAVICGLLFFFAMFFAPVIMAIPACATAPALILVGFMMIQGIGEIDFEDQLTAIPVFLTMIFMPMTYSIANGLIFGILSYVLLNLFVKGGQKVSIVMKILAVLFLIRLLFPMG
jgi:AGZA family xanthine/uracil permease-like MFS transporter